MNLLKSLARKILKVEQIRQDNLKLRRKSTAL